MYNLSIHIRKHGPPSLLLHKKFLSKAKGLGLAAWAYDLAWAFGHLGLARLPSACPGLAPRSLALELALAPRCGVRQPANRQRSGSLASLDSPACLLGACLFVCLLVWASCLLALLLGSWTLDLSSWQLAVACAFCLSPESRKPKAESRELRAASCEP